MIDLLKRISKEGIVIDVNAGELELSSHKTDVDHNILSEIRTHKKELISFLEKNKDLAFKNIEYKRIPKCKENTSYPLSNAQFSLWLASQIGDGATAYNMPKSIVLEGAYDLAYFQKAVYTVIEQHEILRTVFKVDDAGEARQYVLTPEALNFSIDYKDYRGEKDVDSAWRKYVSKDSNKPFNLAEGPLLRAGLLQLSEEQYVFYYNMHHIISDGWSMDVLSKDVMKYYTAYEAGTTPNVTPLKIQYKDYATWQLEQLNSPSYQTHKEYWLSQFNDEVVALDLPTQKKRPQLKTYKGVSIGSGLSSDMTSKLRSFSSEKGGSLFMSLLAMWKVLLYRYTGEKDMVVGCPVEGRDHPDLANQIGCYINALALRNQVNPDAKFTEFYDQVKDNTLKAYEHQVYAFDKLIEDLNLQRNPARSPLFDIIVNYHGATENGLSFKGDKEIEYLGNNTIKFDLELHLTEVSEQGDEFYLMINYNSDVYDQKMVEGLLKHYKRLIAAFLDNPEIKISEVDFLIKEERSKLLNDFNATEVAYAKDKTVLDLFADQAKKTPDAVAVVYEEKEFTYKALEERSSQFANCLINKYEVKKGDFVGVHLDRSEAFIVSVLGILKSGGIYVPIDTKYPSIRKEYIIEDAGIKLLISNADYISEMDYDSGDFLTMDSDINLEEYAKETNVSVALEDLAYVIYTSGSTGNPKGVMIEHGSLFNYLSWCKSYYLKEELSNFNFGLFTSPSFDLTITSLFLPLISGGQLSVFNEEMETPDILNKYLSSDNSCVKLTPSHISLLGMSDIENSNLELVIVGGEELKKTHIDILQKINPEIKIYNEYGPTEATVGCIVYEVKDSNAPIYIGKPIDNARVYILDESKEVAPLGVLGEIYIGGPGLARGYLNRSELTAEKFINHSLVDGKRLYKTGDLACYLPDGNIDFKGRKDHQVKINGYRIELEEIESVLNGMWNLEQSVVLAREDNTGSKQLVAYIVSKELVDMNSLKEGLMLVLEEKLPEYMVPRIFVSLDEMPLTQNGKVDRKALPAPDENAYNTKEYVAPESDTEKKLAEIWQEILGIQKIGVHDNFFHLGGTSISAIRLIGKYNKTFNKKVTIKDIFANSVLENHVGLLDLSSEQAYKKILPVEESESYALSNAQLRLWLTSQIEESSVAYNMPGAIVLDGNYDVVCFQKAIHAVIDRHEILRTVFKVDNSGEVRQYIKSAEDLNFTINIQDYRQKENPQAAFEDYRREDVYKPFNLSSGPLLRAGLFQLSDDQYVFYYNMHHVISDGWSMDILSRDVMNYYEAYRSGNDSDIAPLKIQYKDYAAWQLNQLNNDTDQVHKNYWLSQLSDEVAVINLPTQKKRPQTKTYNGKGITSHLSQEVTSKLRTFTTEKGGSLFTGLLAAWKVLLYHYSGQTDITIGNPVANRDHADLDDQIGFYVNTLPLRNQINPEYSFTKLYEQIKSNTLEAYEHQMYPFDKLLEDLDLRRDTSRSPLFDVLVNYHGLAESGFEFQEGEDLAFTRNGIVKFDLDLNLTEVDKGLDILIKYNRDVYEQEMVEDLIIHYKRLLKGLLEQPEKSISKVAYLLEEEKNKQLYEFNSTQLDLPVGKTVVDLFEEQVLKTPENIALVFKGKEFTYEELNEQSNQLANYLKHNYKIKPNDLVGIKLNRSEWIVVAILAVLKSSGAYIPIDPEYPEDRVKFLLEDSNCKLLINDEILNNFKNTKDKKTEQSFLDPVGPADLAYVIYTSGSTGRPKGVMVNHGSLFNYVAHLHQESNEAAEINMPFIASYAFDISLYELFYPLTTGGRSILLEKETIQDTTLFLSELSTAGATAIDAVPAFFENICDAVKKQEIKFDSSAIKHLFIGGDRVSDQLLLKLKRTFTAAQITIQYGPTEATVFCTKRLITNAGWKEEERGTYIGNPIANTSIYILNDNENLLPNGVTGEICIGGKGVAKGYLNRPELTDEKFIANPFKKGDRIYKTGDLGRWLPDGNLEFIGRKDHQVKIRGYRIELGEIESILDQNAAVEQSVVIARVDKSGIKQLVAYIVGEKDLNTSVLQESLSEKLPEYMVPKIYVRLDEMPLTQNEKVNRKALPVPDESAYNKKRYVAPVSETEKKLVAIWENELNLEKVGLIDDFFDLGGHSLSAVRLMGQYNKVFNKRITIKDIFTNPVLEDHVKLLEESSEAIYKPIAKIADSESYPLSNAQLRLWLTSQVEGGAIAYNMPGAISLDGGYDIDCFQKAIHKVIERHEILRTVFKEDESGEIRQFILSPEELNFAISIQDFRTEKDPEATYKSHISLDAHKPFDLAAGPLLRAGLFRLSDDQYIFYYNLHHIISDGWSMDVLSRDVLSCYEAYLSGDSSSISPLRIQYKDYAVWQLDELEKDVDGVHKSYWFAQLNGELGTINLPTQKRRPSFKTYNGRTIGAHLSEGVTSKLRNFTTANKGSLFTGLLAAWKVLLYRYTGQTDITIGNPVAGRDHPDLENQIGFYINTLILRNQINPDSSFSTFYEQIKSNTLEAYEHQIYPFDKLLEDLDLQRDTSRSPLFDILVDYHGIAESGLGFINDDELIDLGNEMAKFDIELHLTEIDGGVNIIVNYNSDVYEKEMIEKLITHYKNILNEFACDPEKTVGKVEYLQEVETRTLLHEFNATEVDASEDKTVIDLFTEQAQKTPDAISVTFEEETLTYKELDERSTQLANCLMSEYGIKKGDFVGVHLDRSEHYIISIFGILKAGGIYVPIDTAYPSDRKQYIIEDAGISLLILDTSYMFEMEYYEGSLLAIDVEFEHSKYSSENEMSILSNDLAYVIYTSGSTGKPKGTMIGHQALMNYISWCKAYYFDTELTNFDFGLFTSPSFDLTITSLFLPLISGGKLKVFNERLDIMELLKEYLSSNLSCIKLTPSHVSLLKDAGFNDSNLELVIVGGEELKASHIEILQEINPSIKIYNEYGPTETTVGCVVYKVENSEAPIYIGKPIQNMEIYILDSSMKLVPVGVEGELCIGGLGLSKGYINRPDLTAEKFIEHPYKKGERLYRTGDLGYWLADGNIDFKGRKDHQVKLRGYRIELEEIESALIGIEGIEQSIVLAKEDNTGTKQLVAYIVCENEMDNSSIQQLLEQKIPDYMVPKIYVSLDEMPLTQNGKIDRKALPSPDESAYNKQEYIAPSSEEEKVLTSIWESVLNIEKISVKDNFYNLGGDSIKSIQIVARLRQHGYTLKVGDVLATPVLEDMAPLMERVSRVIDQSEVEGEVILTPIQRFLFEDSGIKVLHHFNQSVLLKSKEELDHDILESSIKQLIQHHDVLRMVYQQEGETWKQYNLKNTEECCRIDFHDLRGEEDSLTKMGDLCQNLQAGFDLSKGPLFVVGHFRLSDGDRLAMISHHLLVDGISWRIILEDLNSLYQQKQSGEKVVLPLKTDSFQRWALLQNEYAQSNKLGSEYAYWSRVQDQSIPSLPLDKGTKADKNVHNKTISFVLNEELTSLMQTKIHEVYHTEINDLLLSGLGLAIQDVFGINKSIVQMEGHGREEVIDDVDISRTVGWFTSAYPFILEVSKSVERSRSLIQVKDDLRKIPNKGIGYGILKYLTDRFSSNYTPSIDFNYLGDFGSRAGGNEQTSIFEYGSEFIGKILGEDPDSKSFLAVSGMLVAGSLSMSVSYSSDLFHASSIENLVNSYKENLIALIKELASVNESYLTPSDLTFSNMTFEDLEVINADGLLEDVYKFSPAQEGMYYHWLSSKSAYFEQFSYRVNGGGLNVEFVKTAFDALVDRYSILRTSFTGHYSKQLLQVVKKSVPSGFVYEEFPAERNANELSAWIEERKSADAEKGFNLEESSQMRLTLLDLGGEEYEFIWSYHHILMDGWCTSILVNEFYKILQSVEKGHQPNLPAARPYSDYIKWLEKVDEEETLEYWTDYLSGYTSVAEVYFKQAKDLSQASEGREEKVEFSGDLFEKINTLCKDLGVTFNTFVQVTWGCLLSKYNDTQDVVFGSVVSGRPADLDGVEDMVGLFLNTIPVRIQYEGEDTIREVLKRTQDDAIGSLNHHYVSLANVLGQSELGKSLIDHVIVFENFPVQELIEEQLEEASDQETNTLSFESIEGEVKERTNYGFNLSVTASDTSLKVYFEYDKNRCEESLIKKSANHFYNIVESLVRQPEQYLKEVDYLLEEEKHELMEVFNAPMTNYPGNKTVLDLFKAQVKNTPDAVAVAFGKETLSYKELNERSDDLACHLKKQGLETEMLVPICLERSSNMIIGILGILKAGGVYVPIDATYPLQRIKFILEDTKAKLMVTQSSLLTIFENAQSSLQTVCIDNLPKLNEEDNTDISDITITPNQLAYIIYTSGTSGVPKGVMITHHSLLDYVITFNNYFEVRNKDKVLQQASISFDTSIEEIFPVLLKGGCLYIANAINDFESLITICEEEEITILSTHPYLIQFLNENVNKNDLSLRILISGGDTLKKEYVSNIVDRYNIFNTYGPTESTVCVSYTKIDAADTIISIGNPIANKQVYILSDDLHLQPVGVTGELCVGGSGLAKGYLNLPDLTDEKFIDHPFKDGEKIYKTGDLARWLPNGKIEFLGRKDNQVKILGYRIELGEIQSVLNQMEGIEQSYVMLRENENESKQLIAYIVGDSKLDFSEVQQHLGKNLPHYMIPRLFELLEKMPLTPNGKIDQKALSNLVVDNKQPFVAPSSKIEIQLAEIWKEALAIENIGVHDDFFDLGGNSITAVKIILRLSKVLNVKIDIKALFDSKTIAELAQQIDFSLRQEELKSKSKTVKQIF